MDRTEIPYFCLFGWPADFIITASQHRHTNSIHDKFFSFDSPDSHCKLQLFSSGNETISRLPTTFSSFYLFLFLASSNFKPRTIGSWLHRTNLRNCLVGLNSDMQFRHVQSAPSWVTCIVGSIIIVILPRVFEMRHLLINLNRRLKRTKEKCISPNPTSSWNVPLYHIWRGGGGVSLGRFLQCCFSVPIMFWNAIRVVGKCNGILLPNHSTWMLVGDAGVELHTLLT
jgi:hypothetical protein